MVTREERVGKRRQEYKTSRAQLISRPRKMYLADESSHTQQLSHKLSRGGEHMTDSNGKPIKQITEAAAGKDKYYIIHYRDGSCRTFTRQTGTIKKWLSTQR